MKQINMLVVTDIHYVGKAKHVCNLRSRKTELALELLRMVIYSIDKDKIDLILLLGDLVDNGNALGAEDDIVSLSYELKKLGKPVIVVPGNHDPSPEVVFNLFEDYEGFHEVEGYQFISFAAEYDKNDNALRDIARMEAAFSYIDPDKPIIVLQHNPVYPPIDSPYPYIISEADRIIEYYEKRGVLLSISGHAHWGIPSVVKENVAYLTCPALCEEPFQYTIISMNGYEYDVKTIALARLSIFQPKINPKKYFFS